MTKEEFEAFLASLDPDREGAGEKYEQIRRKLLTFFRGRGLIDSEDAVDKVFDRSAKRSIKGGIENIASFVFGVARKVASEFHRETRETPLNDAEGPPVNPTDDEEDQMAEIRYRCLRRCLGLLEPEQRELVVAWYLYDKGEKIENRKRLAAQRLTTVETLKVRAFRARRKLRLLVEECMMQASSLAAAT
jgi:DNA-directed RNA polymerase specialized sigma24 family protein